MKPAEVVVAAWAVRQFPILFFAQINMKTLAPFAALLLVLATANDTHAQNSAREAFVLLLNDIPLTNVLLEDAALVQRSDPSVTNEAIDRARERVAKAKTAILKIRKLIIVGTGVFDHPGLLAHGRITYDRGYLLYFGAYFSGAEGVGPYEFSVAFDDKGTITAVEDVRHKK